MIFVGDIALPYKGAINYQKIPKEFFDKNWFGNLEGTIVENDNNILAAVYNQKEAVKDVLQNFNFSGFALGNNHIFDTGKYEDTISFLHENNIEFCGIGANLDDANKEIVLEENGQQIVIINFGWEVIQCEIASQHKMGVNPLKKTHVLETVQKLVEQYPSAKVIPFMHWSYELEDAPQPYERELAKRLIDLGAAGVIGCHPHRIGGFELYKNKPIVYSLGNWMFKQNHYFNGKLSFPAFCDMQLAFEWDFDSDRFHFHFFKNNGAESKLEFVNTEFGTSTYMENLTPYKNFAEKDYVEWYKENHYHKNKGLPLYYWNDNKITVFLKNKINQLRDSIIYVLFKVKNKLH